MIAIMYDQFILIAQRRLKNVGVATPALNYRTTPCFFICLASSARRNYNENRGVLSCFGSRPMLKQLIVN